MRGPLLRLLDHPRAGVLAAALGVLLVLPALGGGLGADDWFHRAHLTPELGWFAGDRGPLLELFAFFPAGPGEVRRMVDDGVLPWWTQDDLRGAFFRPLAALTHLVDWWGLGDRPVLHHAHSLLWFGLALVAAHAFLREWLGGRRAALAAFLFAVDESHGLPAAWVANRNALLVLTFGALAARQHLRAQRGERGARWSAAGAVGLALFSAEAGSATLPLLAALELGVPGRPAERLRRWAPTLAVALAWAGVWKGLGYGMHGSALYIDPLGDPARVLARLPERLGALGAAAWLNAPVEGWVLLPPGLALGLGLGLAVLVAATVGALAGPALRAEREARQAAAASILALLPAVATFPMNRVVGLAGLGVAALVAIVTLPTLEGTARRRRDFVALAWHGPVAALLLLGQALGVPWVLRNANAAADVLGDAPEAATQALVLVAGQEIQTAYIPIVRHFQGRPGPAALFVLAPIATPVRLSREGPRTLRVEAPEGGFRHAFERLCREAPFVVGQRARTRTAEVQVLEVAPDGAPLAWRVEFAVDLEDPSLVWRVPDGVGFAPFVPPPIGATVELPAALPVP